MPETNPWAPYEGRFTLAQAAHLLRRAGFGANASQLQRALNDGPQAAVDRILRPPVDLEAFDRRMTALEQSADDEAARLWLYRMRETPWPLLEKMTLFWHNNFAIASSRVNRAQLVAQHLRLLRRHALGRFDALLRDIAHDPAAIIANAADGQASALERYSVGPGMLSANDLREAARAFKGWSVLRDEFYYRRREHEDGAKTGDEVIASVLANPATSQRVVRKLYTWLISETEAPTDTLIAPLAAAFAKDYDIARLTGTMLRSNHFFSPAAYRKRVKSPVEYALSIAIAFDTPVSAATLHPQLARLGQRLLDPPTSDGWIGGRRWLNRFTIVARGNLAATLLAAAKLETQPRLLELLVQNDVPAGLPRDLSAHAIVTLPEFQLA